MHLNTKMYTIPNICLKRHNFFSHSVADEKMVDTNAGTPNVLQKSELCLVNQKLHLVTDVIHTQLGFQRYSVQNVVTGEIFSVAKHEIATTNIVNIIEGMFTNIKKTLLTRNCGGTIIRQIFIIF